MSHFQPIQYADIPPHRLELPILRIQHDDTCLHAIEFLWQSTPTYSVNAPLAGRFKDWLHRYEHDPLTPCDIALKAPVNSFQKRLRNELSLIPCGNRQSYGELAAKLGNSPRAVAQGCRANPLPIVIPCHRVVAKNHWGGYAGKKQGGYLNIKKRLIQHEQNYVYRY